MIVILLKEGQLDGNPLIVGMSALSPHVAGYRLQGEKLNMPTRETVTDSQVGSVTPKGPVFVASLQGSGA